MNTTNITAIDWYTPKEQYLIDYADGFNHGLEAALVWIDKIALMGVALILIAIATVRLEDYVRRNYGHRKAALLELVRNGCMVGTLVTLLTLYVLKYVHVEVVF